MLAELSAAYAASAVAPVVTAPADAAERLEFARQQIAGGREDVAAGRNGEAAVDAMAAEGAVGQAQQLLDSVERLRRELAGGAGAHRRGHRRDAPRHRRGAGRGRRRRSSR